MVVVATAGDARVPAFLPELADLEWTDLSAYLDPAEIPTAGPWALNPTAALRSYRHEVVAFWEDEEAVVKTRASRASLREQMAATAGAEVIGAEEFVVAYSDIVE